MPNQSLGPVQVYDNEVASLNDALKQIQDRIDYIQGLRGAIVLNDNLTASNLPQSNINAAQLESKTWEIPGTIGSATPNTGAFSTLSSSGQITSTLATGTNPLSVASTTPSNLESKPVVYNAAGTQQTANHIVQGTVTLAAGTATVTLSGSAVFTSNTSYTCIGISNTSVAAVKVTQTSGSSITFTGTGTDVIRFICVGN